MLTALTWITIALAVVYVVVLAVTLILTAYHLLRGAGFAEKLAGGLEAVDTQTRELPGYISTINGAMLQLRGGLKSVDGHFERLAKAAGLE
ncbi:MAG TPA: hypothetical protein VIN39_00310 [Candidatus Dormibacteraeota bacterium]|jgi:hypothetical protein